MDYTRSTDTMGVRLGRKTTLIHHQQREAI
jgi:hypothetical protein